jgi:TonB family protein
LSFSERDDYRSWSFTDRSFLFAVLVSVLWHLFWFFSVTMVVTPPKKQPRALPKVMALGPVLNDAIFKTLVETRPEISKAFYRQPADILQATDVPAQSVERYAPGDVVSVPLGRKFSGALRELVGGSKAAPDIEPLLARPSGPADYFELSGPLDVSQILSRPSGPPSGGMASALPVEIEFLLDAGGGVSDANVTLSSGDALIDRAWLGHLRQWLFTPESALAIPPGGRARVKFRVPDSEGRP